MPILATRFPSWTFKQAEKAIKHHKSQHIDGFEPTLLSNETPFGRLQPQPLVSKNGLLPLAEPALTSEHKKVWLVLFFSDVALCT